MKAVRWYLMMFAVLPAFVTAAPLPGDSIYQINSQWVDQHNRPMDIRQLSGKVQVLTFIYTYCEHSCPVILQRLKRLDASLSATQRQHVQFLLVSLDPARDTPKVMGDYMRKHGLSESTWTMLNGAPDDVLELSALVGVRYQPMDTEGSDIAHSNMMTVLDRQGRINYQMKGLNDRLETVVDAIADAIEKNNE